MRDLTYCPQSDHVGNHFLADILTGNFRKRDAYGSIRGDLTHKCGVHNQESFWLKGLKVMIARGLIHGKEKIRLHRLGIIDGLFAHNHLCLAVAAPGLRAVTL